MKTLRFSFALLLAAATGLAAPLSAQTTLGVKAGVSIADISASEEGTDVSFDSRTGFIGGGFANFQLGETFFLQPELLYAQKGAKDAFDGIDSTIKLDYLQIPVLLGAAFGIGDGGITPRVFAGPQVGFELSCNVSAEIEGISASADCTEAEIETKSVDFGLVFGAGLGIPVGGFEIVIDGRYDLGLTNVDDSDSTFDVSAKNRAWEFMAGVGFPVGG
jgi:hypothetical protein